MSENDKLECLRRLQDVLSRKFELENQVETIPQNLRHEEHILEHETAKLNELEEKCRTVNEEVKSLSIKYDDAFNTRTGYEKQMEFLNTQREYEAMSKQLDEAKVQESSLLRLRNSKIQETETVGKELEAQKVIVEEQTAKVSEEKGRIDSILDDVKRQIAETDAECEEIKSGNISEDLFEKFSNIVKKKKGVGIVPVYGQVCMGCDRVLPMQFVIDLRLKMQQNEIEYCPYCSRIIYYEQLDPEMEKNYIFEQLESSKSEGKGSAESAKSDSDSYDESMGMEDGFEDF